MGANLTNWHRIVASLQQINLLQERDVFVWDLNASGAFTVKSMYAALINNEVTARYLANEAANENKSFHVVSKKRSDSNQRQLG